MTTRDRELFILKKMFLNIGMFFLAIGCVNYFLNSEDIFGTVLMICSTVLILIVSIFFKVKKEGICHDKNDS